ncbi:hypothetical protein F5B22DRAFT_633870 [Xylaria bambusicola]|uniref:uncharacterized protein n=1 Tax=Xylaria bambusicola TaxID=326684 RepID=UPI002008DECB|nr:uncharacterized protein F5B22DRAFT_633870 [Xylaria bambusicola]KAI0523761.1 hypothetical protein F5B22DRAFT_633870 [Xylaria bambusicola]
MPLILASASAADFVISNGQIFTPGFAILDAPQPGTPLGGDTIEVALDVSANGKLNLPPYDPDSPSLIHNITIFLYSYDTGRNFTITNGTASENNASLGDIMLSEPGSTVKHVKWTWPDCLIGDGQPDSPDSDRGEYNISIRQNFRLNDEDHYTIFDVPISVTNRIDFAGNNPACDSVDNPLLTPEEIDAEAANNVGVLFAPGDATVIQQTTAGSAESIHLEWRSVVMPIHNGLIPREGFTGDVILKLLGRTAFNPSLLLPVYLLAKFTKKGEDLTMLHPTAYSRFKAIFYLALVRYLSKKISDRVTNGWSSDTYNWPEEIAVVTGGSGGIGGHVVKLLAEKGLKVVVLDIQPMTFDAGPNVHYFKCDITSSANLAAVAKEIRAKVGEPTILVNNAGVARGKTILETSEKDLKFTFDVNVFAHYNTVKEFLPSMIRKNHGMVVTVASLAAWLTVPSMVDYAMSKTAAMSFHEGLSAELKTRYNAPKVRTVIVNQGYTKTALFTGYYNDSPFLMPALEPESVADGICRQIFTGRSGQVIMPAFGRIIQLIQALPHWYSYGLRAKGENIMTNWKGRQVVQDLDTYYADKEKVTNPEESTVLVPEHS